MVADERGGDIVFVEIESRVYGVVPERCVPVHPFNEFKCTFRIGV
jgi:hypothetical protein